MKNARRNIGRSVVLAGVALAVMAQSFAVAAPAHAQGVQSPGYFNRATVIKRAQTWTRTGVPYSQTGWLRSYRTDCSGFVSMAWGLDRSYVTWSLPEIARPIAKQDLQPGDIILNTSRHVVLFGGWANGAHTAYRVYEEVGGPWHRAITRVVSYPYDSPTASDYKPYRFVGGHNLNAPGNTLPAPLMSTNAGSGQVVDPSAYATRANQHTLKVAAQRQARILRQTRLQAKAKRLAETQAAAKKASDEALSAKAGRAMAAKARYAADTAARPAAVQLFNSLVTFLAR